MANDYYFKVIGKPHPAIVFGGHIQFEEILFKDLQIGDKVTHIGNKEFRGGIAANNRLDSFNTYVTYVGMVKENINKDGTMETLLMFQIPPDEIQSDEPAYLGYILLSVPEEGFYELKVPDITDNTVRLYHPMFTKYKEPQE